MSTISKKQFKQYIEDFDFTGLFNQLGWTYLHEQTPVKLKEETYFFHSVAEKGGFRILVFKPAKHQDLPDYATRLQLDRKIGKLYREHLIIFCDKNNATQIWQLFVKQLGKPARLSETRWYKGQEPELLYQKTSNLFFTLDQEENITIADVVDVVNENFSKNVDQVTKKFYENFRKEHKKFIDFIKGISVVADREWYASLMLNRLMFCYFIQKKGFLDSNLNYLKDKLSYSQNKKGKDKFYVSFYKNFLLALFHQGLGSPDQSEDLKKEIGKIPYLNGGLFDVHELEKQYEDIDISDKAFENIFHFFDQYNWHLDTRIDASGKDINPDVIGYIFEKYINDRAQMGAYYTKEDITDYISKNCIIPFLFDETERKYAKAFKPEAEIWKMLKESGDTYIYDAVKKGINTENLDINTNIDIDNPNHPLWSDLPEEIRAGFRPDLKVKLVVADAEPHLWQIRKAWNQFAPESIALPTEIYRELIDRRKRYWEIRKKIEAGEITHINHFITYNLNIRQFTQDIIDSHSDPDFIRHFYEALNNITILDPTCGSGAFLFAAMNILEPLYESCIQRMENFVVEAPKGKYAKFEEILKYVKAPEHPNLKYFVFKNIILRNLYGVDIMKEAVEIAKLRLFLKLVATVEADYKKPNLGLEPLPDIDFNIRSGNTLIGYASETEIKDAFAGTLDFDNDAEKIKEKCDIVARTFKRYKEIQLNQQNDYKDFKNAKDELNNRLNQLNHELSLLLAKTQYGIDINKNQANPDNPFKSWFRQHFPFHWFAEFYEIIHDKRGFDVVIGNPPYVECSKINYKLNGYNTIKCGNLYPFVIERSSNITSKLGKTSMIIPISSICTDRMIDYQKLILNGTCWNSLYAERPSKLFSGAEVQLVISIMSMTNSNEIYSSTYNKWGAAYRVYLFDNVSYVSITNLTRKGSFPKIGTVLEKSILTKLNKQKKSIINYQIKNSSHIVSYRNAGGRYYKVILNYEPIFKVNNEQKRSSTYQFLFFENNNLSDSFCALMNSTLFFWYWLMYSDTWHMVNREIGSFPIEITNDLTKRLYQLNKKLMNDIKVNSIQRCENRNKGADVVEFTQFNVRESKPIIDEIDTVLAEHYGFTEEELDFIINYDIKYRMGKELEENV
ncbi:MAG: hypothetical protein PWR04_10 [Anaerophaga sp.]|nr:hypothetical protein [Anaerophaga sp.]